MIDSMAEAYFLGVVVGFVMGSGLTAWLMQARTRGPFEEPTPRDRHGMEW